MRLDSFVCQENIVNDFIIISRRSTRLHGTARCGEITKRRVTSSKNAVVCVEIDCLPSHFHCTK
ncbi:unnamed protein product [Hymenolepis diminuta]|uniref:Uncharacterized protein n=1 Tax=Hymenolepis diminuta TaxID=6216 RepID=A0A564XWD5_HYMDI|nr:unnamed protein product [Hymenolepis diminuta]